MEAQKEMQHIENAANKCSKRINHDNFVVKMVNQTLTTAVHDEIQYTITGNL